MIRNAAVSRPAILRLCSAGVAVALVVLAPQARAQASAQQQRMAAFKAAQQQNAAAQRGYSWMETTQVAYQGEVKSTETSSCQYTASSKKPVCTPTGAPPEQKSQRGPLRKEAAKSKVDELKTYMDSVKTLIAQYVPPQQEKIQVAEGRGDVSTAPNPATGAVKITINNYLEKGDAVAISVNATNNQMMAVDVNSWLNDPSATVTLAVQFITLPNGVTFPSKKVLTATAKEVQATITSSNFALAVAQ